MSWPEIGELAAILAAVAVLIWVSIKFGGKQALVLLTVAFSLILFFVVPEILGGTSASTQPKWSEAQRRAFRNYAVLTGLILLAGAAVFIAFYILRKTLDS